jgi:hypothetical protein
MLQITHSRLRRKNVAPKEIITAKLRASDTAAAQSRAGLFIANRRTPAVVIVPDETWPGQWRVIEPDGSLSDHTNLARAMDAALDQAEAVEAQKRPHKSPLKTLNNFRWSALPMREKSAPHAEGCVNSPACADGGAS